jgi:hypothetical protein
MEGEAHLRRERLVYGGGGSSYQLLFNIVNIIHFYFSEAHSSLEMTGNDGYSRHFPVTYEYRLRAVQFHYKYSSGLVINFKNPAQTTLLVLLILSGF